MADEIDALLAEMTGGENGTKREQESEATGNSNKQRHTKRADLEAAAAAILAWTMDETAVTSWARAISLQERAGNRDDTVPRPLAEISDFFPHAVAAAVRTLLLQSLQSYSGVSSSAWQLSDASLDQNGGKGYGAGSVSHHFSGATFEERSCDGGTCHLFKEGRVALASLFNAVATLLPQQPCSFAYGRYT